MKKVNYNTLAKAIKEIRRTEENDNIRVAIYVNEEMGELYADLQIEYEEQCIVLSSYELKAGEMEFWSFYELAKRKFKKQAEKVKAELEKRAYNVEILAYTC